MREELNLSTTSTELARQALSGLGLRDADIERVEVSVILSEAPEPDEPDDTTSTDAPNGTAARSSGVYQNTMEHAAAWLLIEYLDDTDDDRATAIDLHEYAEQRFTLEPPRASAIGNALARLTEKNLTTREKVTHQTGGWAYRYAPSDICREAVEELGQPDLSEYGKTNSDWHP